jgi:hypothetical protein
MCMYRLYFSTRQALSYDNGMLVFSSVIFMEELLYGGGKIMRHREKEHLCAFIYIYICI